MKTEHKIIASSVALGLLFGVIDAILDYLFFYERSLWELLITNVPPRELYIRSVAIILFFAFGLIIAGFVNKRKQAEEELRETRDYLESLIRYANAPIIVWDTKQRVTIFNTAFERLAGYRDEEVVGQPLSMLFPEASRDGSLAKIKQTLSGEYWESVEIPILRKDGEIRTALWNSANIYGKDGKTLQATIAQGQDITERQQAGERKNHLTLVLRAIRKVNQLITREKDRQKLLKGSCDNLTETRGYYNAWIALLDESGELVAHAESGLGKSFLPVVERLKRGQLTACAQRALKQPEAVVTENPVSTCNDCLLSNGYTGRSGLTVRLEYEGKVYGFLCVSAPSEVVTDVEELDLFREVAGDIAFALHNIELEEDHKQAEEALQKSEEKWRSLVENAPNVIIIVEPDSTIQFINRTMPSIDSESPIGKSIYDYIQPEYHDVVRETIQKVFETGEPGGYQIRGAGPDGSISWYETQAGPIKRNGRIVAVTLITLEITERKQAEEKERELQVLKEMDDLRSQFMSNISHELRTPLTSIQGFTLTLLRTDVKWSEEDQRDFLETMSKESDRLARLIGDLLDISRLDAGGLKLNATSCHISEILVSIGSNLASLAERHRFKTIVSPELPTIVADETRIGQVLTNLVENAVKFSPEGSEITIEARLAGDEIVTSVTDRGVGIRAGMVEKIFDRFIQAESVVTGQKKGTGLGLSICRGILEAHGGRIWVESKPGKGSKFSFSLPLSQKEK